MDLLLRRPAGRRLQLTKSFHRHRLASLPNRSFNSPARRLAPLEDPLGQRPPQRRRRALPRDGSLLLRRRGYPVAVGVVRIGVVRIGWDALTSAASFLTLAVGARPLPWRPLRVRDAHAPRVHPHLADVAANHPLAVVVARPAHAPNHPLVQPSLVPKLALQIGAVAVNLHARTTDLLHASFGTKEGWTSGWFGACAGRATTTASG